MINEDLAFRVDVVVAIHDETSDVAAAVNPAWALVESSIFDLKLHPSGSLKCIAVEYHFLHTLVVDKSGEEFVCEPALEFVRFAAVHGSVERVDPTLYEVGTALPVFDPMLLFRYKHRACSVVGCFLRLRIGAVKEERDFSTQPVSCSADAEQLR